MEKFLNGTQEDVQIAEQFIERVQSELDDCLMNHRYKIKSALLVNNYLYINIKSRIEIIDKYDLEIINKINEWKEIIQWVITTNPKEQGWIIQLTISGWKIK